MSTQTLIKNAECLIEKILSNYPARPYLTIPDVKLREILGLLTMARRREVTMDKITTMIGEATKDQLSPCEIMTAVNKVEAVYKWNRT